MNCGKSLRILIQAYNHQEAREGKVLNFKGKNMNTDHENWQDNSDENQSPKYEENRSYNRESRFNRATDYGREGEGRPYRPSFNRNSGERSSFGKGDRPQRPRFSRPATGSERVNYSRDNRPSFNREGNESRPYRPSYNRDEGERRPYRPYNREGNERPNNYSYDNRSERPRNYNSYDSEERPRFRRTAGEYGNGYNNNYSRNERPRFNYYDNRRPQGNFRPNRSDRYDPNAKYSKKKQFEYKEVLADPNEPIRLNKYLANAGICSRREADEFITAGAVSVNGEVVTELGTKVKRSDSITFHNNPVSIERRVYILLNKPKDCVTTSDDPQDRKTVMDFVKGACNERIYPVGRLDRNTTGVLLLTNDGDLASKLTHPQYLKKKIYHVHCDKNVTQEDMERIATGITLDDGEVHADEISYVSEDKSEIGIEIHSGKNRIVRRIFESLGYRVVKLDRVFFAGLTKKNLRRGQWRYLTEKEVNMLRMGAFE